MVANRGLTVQLGRCSLIGIYRVSCWRCLWRSLCRSGIRMRSYCFRIVFVVSWCSFEGLVEVGCRMRLCRPSDCRIFWWVGWSNGKQLVFTFVFGVRRNCYGYLLGNSGWIWYRFMRFIFLFIIIYSVRVIMHLSIVLIDSYLYHLRDVSLRVCSVRWWRMRLVGVVWRGSWDLVRFSCIFRLLGICFLVSCWGSLPSVLRRSIILGWICLCIWLGAFIRGFICGDGQIRGICWTWRLFGGFSCWVLWRLRWIRVVCLSIWRCW
jgi:hypothetical protein